jgi:RpiB/LacA/LacB family sugar-phosphate isomerase
LGLVDRLPVVEEPTQIAGEWRPGPRSCDFLYLKIAPGQFAGEFMIAFACDHGGVELKDFLVDSLRTDGVVVSDYGTHGKDSVDYPDYAREVCRRVVSGVAARGVLVCTSGIGMSISANKFPGVRAALVQDLDGACSSREHNDANVLVLSGAKTDKSLARQIIDAWLATPFAGGRHQRRVDKITQTEKDLGTRLIVETEKR